MIQVNWLELSVADNELFTALLYIIAGHQHIKKTKSAYFQIVPYTSTNSSGYRTLQLVYVHKECLHKTSLVYLRHSIDIARYISKIILDHQLTMNLLDNTVRPIPDTRVDATELVRIVQKEKLWKRLDSMQESLM